jgi:hypothetical protein
LRRGREANEEGFLLKLGGFVDFLIRLECAAENLKLIAVDVVTDVRGLPTVVDENHAASTGAKKVWLSSRLPSALQFFRFRPVFPVPELSLSRSLGSRHPLNRNSSHQLQLTKTSNNGANGHPHQACASSP